MVLLTLPTDLCYNRESGSGKVAGKGVMADLPDIEIPREEWPEGAVKYLRNKDGVVYIDAKGHFLKRVRDPKPERERAIVPENQHRPKHILTNEDRVRRHTPKVAQDLQTQLDFPLIAIVEDLAEKYHLTKNMTNFLAVRLNFGSDSEAARSIGLSKHAASSWRWDKDIKAQFNLAYDELMQKAKEASQAKLNTMRYKTVTRMDELLDAERTVTRTIKTEDGTEQITETEPDYNARFQGIQAVSRWLGEWGTEQRIVQNTQYVTVMDEFGKLMQRISQERIVEGEMVNE